MQKISFLLNEAHAKLTRLGLSLFYFYLFLVVAGFGGIIFGISAVVMKLIPMGVTVASSIGNLLLLAVASWFMIKIFWRESLNLIGKNKVSPLENPQKNAEKKQAANSNVIPFQAKNNNW
jgi:hypothetical protein